MSIPFACTTAGCDEIVLLSEHTVDGEWFDPEDIVCRDCAAALVPEDVKSMRAAPTMETALAGYDAELDLDLFGRIPS